MRVEVKANCFLSSLIPPPSSPLVMRAAIHQYVPQVARREVSPGRVAAVWGLAAVMTLGFVALAVAAPLALAGGHELTAAILYQGFGRICHQISARAFYLHGHPLAVCARCFGIYAGFALSVLCYPLVRSLRRTDAPARAWLFAAALPAAIDFSLTFFGLWENTHTSRLLTGAILGVGAVFFVMPGLIDLGQTRLMKFFSTAASGRREAAASRGGTVDARN